MDKAKMFLCFSIVLMFGILVAVIAVGRVEKETSHGLEPLIVALTAIGTKAADWAFHIEKK